MTNLADLTRKPTELDEREFCIPPRFSQAVTGYCIEAMADAAPAQTGEQWPEALHTPGWFWQTAVFGYRLHRSAHPHLEHFLLVSANVLGKLAYRGDHTILVEVFPRFEDLVPLCIVEIYPVSLRHGTSDFGCPGIHID